jgi:hypothetical protein
MRWSWVPEMNSSGARSSLSAINLAERVRDVGVQVVVAAQSVEGLGDHRQAPRLLAACAGGIVVQQCPDPERLLALAGQTVRRVGQRIAAGESGPGGCPHPSADPGCPCGPCRDCLGVKSLDGRPRLSGT